MTRSLHAAGLAGLSLAGVLLFAANVAAAPLSVQFNGNTYYLVNGNDPKMDTGDEVCASIKMKCVGYKSINTNSICKLFHPNAKELVSVNGSKAGFYCNGAPQTGLACGKMMNTCQVCPACNLNEAETCSQPIGKHFREMYVWCGTGASSSSAKSSSKMYGPLPLAKTSSSRSSSRRSVSSTSSSVAGVNCTFSQSPLKKVTCSAPRAADNYCVTVMQSAFAKATSCSETGNVVCSVPCTAPNAANITRCAFGGVKSGGCFSSSKSSSAAAKKSAGALCAHGGECASGMCLGVVPGREYRCSCMDPLNRWEGCRK